MTMPRWPPRYSKKTRWGNPALRSGVATACRVPAKPQKYVSSTRSGFCHQHAAAATRMAMSQSAKGRSVLGDQVPATSFETTKLIASETSTSAISRAATTVHRPGLRLAPTQSATPVPSASSTAAR